LIRSAHDVSEGGLFFCLLEKALIPCKGFEISLPEGVRQDLFLFDEAQSRVVVTVDPAKEEAFLQLLNGFNFLKLGSVTANDSLTIDNESFLTLKEWTELYSNSLPQALAAKG
jgi:phosphoribosylformylglycinamidine synthase subunit PurL